MAWGFFAAVALLGVIAGALVGSKGRARRDR